MTRGNSPGGNETNLGHSIVHFSVIFHKITKQKSNQTFYWNGSMRSINTRGDTEWILHETHENVTWVIFLYEIGSSVNSFILKPVIIQIEHAGQNDHVILYLSYVYFALPVYIFLTECLLRERGFHWRSHLHAKSYLHIHSESQKLKILILLALRLEYSRRNRSIPWLLMLWLLASPDHQQSRYWSCRTHVFLSSMGNDLNYLRYISIKKWRT